MLSYAQKPDLIHQNPFPSLLVLKSACLKSLIVTNFWPKGVYFFHIDPKRLGNYLNFFPVYFDFEGSPWEDCAGKDWTYFM